MTQTQFRTALLTPDAPVPAGVIGPTGQSSAKRFNVYRNNVTTGLCRALADNFPAIRSLVGSEFFQAMAVEFVRACPPNSPLMAGYGLALPDFLAQFPPTQPLGYLPDVARLELAIRQSYHAGDHDPKAGARLGTLDEARLMQTRLRLAPSFRLLISDWPVLDIWNAALSGGPKPRYQAQSVIVARPAFDPMPHLLPTGAGAFLQALIDMVTIGQAIAAHPDTDVLAVLTLLATTGSISEVMS